MKKLLTRFIKAEKGLETIEWTLMAAIVVLGFLVIYDPVSEAVVAVFSAIAGKLNAFIGG